MDVEHRVVRKTAAGHFERVAANQIGPDGPAQLREAESGEGRSPADDQGTRDSDQQRRNVKVNRFARFATPGAELSNYGVSADGKTASIIRDAAESFAGDADVMLRDEPVGHGAYVRILAPPKHPVWADLGAAFSALDSPDRRVQALAQLAMSHSAGEAVNYYPDHGS